MPTYNMVNSNNKKGRGRAHHNLLAKDCGLCNCVIDTYRCNPKCCPKEDLDNGRFTVDDLKNLICQIIFDRVTRTQMGGLAGLASEICTYTFPKFDCPIPLYVRLESDPEADLLPVSTILNGECTDINTETGPVSDDYLLFIDNFQCTTITFVLSSP